MSAYSLDAILDQLERSHQRATYGAVGALVDRPPFYSMGGRPRDHRHSWIVNQETGLPTGYQSDQMDPHIHERKEILSSPETLEDSLKDPR